MSNQKQANPDQKQSSVQTRVELRRVTIDTTALLNLIKHCNDHRGTGVSTSLGSDIEVSGKLNGVLQTQIGDQTKSYLFVNGTLPNVGKPPAKSLKARIEEELESQKNSEASSEIGFYVSSELGAAFTLKNLHQMIISYRNFRNSVMIVYDLNKSQHGINPLHCFRLSKSAIDSLYLNDLAKLTSILVQDQINNSESKIESFFEQVELKIHRSHLLQAFLFDHIQANVPSFNSQMFNMGSNSTLFTHQLYRSNERSQLVLEELQHIENQHKKMIQQAKKNNKKLQQSILANRDVTVKGGLADKEEREALENVKINDNANNKLDLFLLSNQIDALYSNIQEFDDCFQQEE